MVRNVEEKAEMVLWKKQERERWSEKERRRENMSEWNGVPEGWLWMALGMAKGMRLGGPAATGSSPFCFDDERTRPLRPATVPRAWSFLLLGRVSDLSRTWASSHSSKLPKWRGWFSRTSCIRSRIFYIVSLFLIFSEPESLQGSNKATKRQ